MHRKATMGDCKRVYDLVCGMEAKELRTDAHRFYEREGMRSFHFKFSTPLREDAPTENALGR